MPTDDDQSWPPAIVDRDPDLWTSAAHPDSAEFVVAVVLIALYGIEDAFVMPGIGTAHIPVPSGSVFLADRYGNHPDLGHRWGMRVGRCFDDGRDETDLWTDLTCTDLRVGVDHLLALARHLRAPDTVSITKPTLPPSKAPADPADAVGSVETVADAVADLVADPDDDGYDMHGWDRAAAEAFVATRAAHGDTIPGGATGAERFVEAYLAGLAAHDEARDRGETTPEPQLADLWQTWTTTGDH